MSVKIKYEGDEKEVDAEEGTAVKDILKALGVNPETVITEKEGKLVSLEEEVANGEELRLINVVSGG